MKIDAGLAVTITSTRTDGGNTFVTVNRTAALAGTFTGSATETDTIVFHSDGTTIVHGQGTCTCTVDGVSGTFSYRAESSGTFPTSVSGQYVAQGWGGLAGLHAEGPLLRELRGRDLRRPAALQLATPRRVAESPRHQHPSPSL